MKFISGNRMNQLIKLHLKLNVMYEDRLDFVSLESPLACLPGHSLKRIGRINRMVQAHMSNRGIDAISTKKQALETEADELERILLGM